MVNLTYPSTIAPYTFRKDFDYSKYLEQQSHFDNLATDIDQSIAKLALSNAEIARLSTETLVESQRRDADRFSEGLGAISVGIEKLDDSIVDLRHSVDNTRWAIDEVRYAIEGGFQLTAQRLASIEGILENLLESVRSPEKTWALEKYEIAKDLYRRELYENALSYLNDALHGHGDHRGYLFDPRPHILKGNILMGDGENFEPKLIDLPAARQCFEEAVKYAKPPRDMLSGAHDAMREQLFQPRVFARCCSAWASYVQGNIAEAETTYHEAVKEGPNDARAHYYFGKVLAHQGRFEEAEQALDKAIRVNFLYVAKLASDQDYLKDRRRFERKVAEYRLELLERLKPFAEVLCLIQGPKAYRLFTEWPTGDSTFGVFDNLPNLGLAQSIAAKSAEIGPMVSNYEQLKRDALRAQRLIEELARRTDSRLSQARTFRASISKPKDSAVFVSQQEASQVKVMHRKIGGYSAGILLLFSILTQSGGIFILTLLASGYALVGAKIFELINEGQQKNKERSRLRAWYKETVVNADQEIATATQKNQDAKTMLEQLRRVTPKLTEAPG